MIRESQIEELGQLAREHASVSDGRAQLHDAVVERILELGLFRLWIPRSCGGLELDLPHALKVYESAAYADGSLGWAVMIGAGGGLFGAFLEPGVAAEIFGPANAVIAGSGTPDGRAERVQGGDRATGRWRYASGAPYATTFTANCIVTSGGVPVRSSEGEPLIRAMAFDLSQVEIIPTWDPSGMRATASHDFQVKDVFVPEARSFSVFTDAPREPGPLYRLPFGVLTELPVSAVAVGIARHALDSFAALARRKKGLLPHATLAEEPAVRAQYAEAHARWCSSRALLDALASRSWETAMAARTLTPRELAEITACSVHCISALRDAVNGLASLAGMTALVKDDELARAVRDLGALSAHVAVSPRHYASAGAQLLATP